MIDISVEINGRKVDPRNMKNVLEGAIIASVVDSIKKSVQGIRCPEHGTSPTLKVKGRNLDNLNIEVTGCCEKLKELTTKKLK